jgi:D-alanyl-D-alanine carboxypeptidase
MTFSRVFFVAFGLCAALASATAATRAKPSRPAIGDAASGAYKGALVIDAATGQTLFEDRPDIVSPPASMTKLMTFAVVHDKLASGSIALDTPIRITDSDSGIGGSQVYLDPRETFPVEELLYAMMIHSANDAAHALARASAGSVEAFIGLMNAKAQALGMAHTTFRTPHGLPPSNRRIAEGDLSSPRDFSLLARYLVQHTDVLKYSSIRTRTFGAGQRAKLTEMTNSDHLLGKVRGVDGLKTGFTNGAGFCLSTTALRDGKRVIVVLMGSPASATRDLKVAELVDRGFAALPPDSPAFVAGASPIAVPSDAEPSPISAAPLPAKPAPAPAPAPQTDAPPAIKLVIPKKK